MRAVSETTAAATYGDAIATTKLNRFNLKLRELIDASSKKQWEIARDVGYEKPNIITMFKQGVSRVPAEKVASFAITLGADPADLLLLWFSEYNPALLADLQRHVGLLCNSEERQWITGLRERFPRGLPSWNEVTQAQSSAPA